LTVNSDPELHLIIDGTAVQPRSAGDLVYSFAVPAGARRVTIASRSVVPAEAGGGSLDPRRLGVPLQRLTLKATGALIEIGPDYLALRDGFHEDEGSHRWTDGSAVIPTKLLACLSGKISLDVQIGAIDLEYPEELNEAEPLRLHADADL
jgi:hypothetical protein